MNIDDVKHSDDDLDLFEEDGIDQDDVSTDGDATGDDADEQSDLLDDLPSERERNKQNQIEAQFRKIQNGEISLKDLESNSNLAWLVPHVKERIKSEKNSSSKEELAQIAREEARKILEEERNKSREESEEGQFQELKNRIKSVSLTKDQKSKLKERYESLVGKIGRYQALSIAAEVAGVDFEENIDDRKKQMPGVRQGWGSVKRESIDFSKVDPNSLSAEARQEYVMSKKYGKAV